MHLEFYSIEFKKQSFFFSFSTSNQQVSTNFVIPENAKCLRSIGQDTAYGVRFAGQVELKHQRFCFVSIFTPIVIYGQDHVNLV